MKFAILNDTHCGIRNSSDIFIDYQEQFYRDVFFPYLLEHDIKHIVHLGDYYEHRRFINFKSAYSNRKTFLNKLREYGITMDIIPGNHDTYYKNTNALNSLKELQGYYMNEVNIVMEPRVMDYDGFKFALIPWICQDNYNEVMTFLENADVKHIGAHLELTGFEMLRGVDCTNGMDPSIFSKFDMVLSGHFHNKSCKGNITYLGSQMQFSWNDAGEDKYFHVFDTDTATITPIKNPITIYEKLYYDDSTPDGVKHLNKFMTEQQQLNNKFVKVYVINKSDIRSFELFLDRIQSYAIHELKINENFNEFLGSNVDDSEISVEDTPSLLSSYIDAISTGLDKDKIKSEVFSLMQAAQSLEVS